MSTICVIHGIQGGGSSQVLGAVVEESAKVKGAVQQYLKAIGPLNNRSAFNDFVRQNKFQIASCVPIDVDKI